MPLPPGLFPWCLNLATPQPLLPILSFRVTEVTPTGYWYAVCPNYAVLYLTLSPSQWEAVLWPYWECLRGTGTKRVSFHRGPEEGFGNGHWDQITMLYNWKKRELGSEGLDMNPVAAIYSCGQTLAPLPVRRGDCENQLRACGWNTAFYKWKFHTPIHMHMYMSRNTDRHIGSYIYHLRVLGWKSRELDSSPNPAITSLWSFEPFT